MTPTPHIEASLGEIAKTVLMPGDPLRAKLIAEKFLVNPKLVSSVRNILCFTGLYKDKPISIMASGMGCASMGIYSYELYNFYNVENIIRIGTIGSLNEKYKIGDIILASSTITNTNYLDFYKENGEAQIFCSNKLLNKAKELAKVNKLKVNDSTIYTSDTFYDSQASKAHKIDLKVAGVEMECASLYINAKILNKNALTICTVSDEILTGKTASSFDRQNLFLDMAKLALDLGVSL